jgi:hypothetical protein
MNGATEATLAELLAVAQAQNVNLLNAIKELKKQTDELKKSSGGGSSSSSASSAASGLVNLASAINPVSIAFKALSGAASIVSGFFEGLGSILGKLTDGILNTTANFIQFAKSAMEGKATLEGLVNVFKDLPFFIGSVAGLLATFIGVFEKNLDRYREFTKVGASFSGNISTMAIAAAEAHLTLDQLQRVVTQNSEVFATMGNNVQSGIDIFLATQNKLMDTNGPYAKRLLALGLTSEDAADGIARLMRSQGTMNKQQLSDSSLVSRMVVEYTEQMDDLVKITGKRKDQIQAEVDEIAVDPAFEAFMANISDAEEAARIMATITEATAYGGKEMGQQQKLAAMGFNYARTEQQKALVYMTNGASLEYTQRLADAAKSGRSIAEISKIARDGAKENGDRIRDFNTGLNGLTGVLSATGHAAGSAGSTFDKTTRNVANMDEAQRKAAKQRGEQENGQVISLAMARQKLIDFGNQLTIIAFKIINPLINPILEFGEAIASALNNFVHSGGFNEAVKFVTGVVKDLWGAMKELWKWSTEYYTSLKKIYDQGSWEAVFSKIWNDATESLGEMWDNIWPVVQPRLEKAFTNLADYLKPAFEKLMKTITDTISDWMGEKMPWLFENKKDRLAREAVQGSDDYKNWENSDKATKRSVGVFGRYDRSSTELYEQYQAQIERGMYKPGFDQSGRRIAEYDTRVQGKATGGLVSPGSYLVGEKGPELVNVGNSGDVINNDNLTKLLANASGNNNSNQQGEQLNTLIAQLLHAQRESNDLSRRQLNATKGLSGNLFA